MSPLQPRDFCTIHHLGQRVGIRRLFLGFGGVAGWGDGPASRVQATELPIFPLVLVGGLEDLEETNWSGSGGQAIGPWAHLPPA